MPRSPDRRRGRPGGHHSRRTGPNVDTSTDLLTVTHGDAVRELEAWAAAVLWLHSLDLPAAVPPFPAAWLRRRGIYPDWTVAA